MRKIHSILLLIAFFLIQCNNVRLVKNPDFTITNAVYYSWSGGQPGVSGTNIRINVENATEVNFGAVYFRGQQTKLERKTKYNNILLLAYFPKKVKTTNFILDKNSVKELQNKPLKEESQFPFKLEKNEIVISYSYKEKIRYFKTTVVKSETKQL